MSLPDAMSTRGAPPSGKFTRRTAFIMPFPKLPTSHRRQSELAIVTWVAGEAAYKWFSVTGPAMKRYSEKVGADFVVLEGYSSQPYFMANKFRVKQLFDEYGYESVLYVDADILIRSDCVNFFEIVPENHVAILDEGKIYDYWMLAHFRHEAIELLKSQGITPELSTLPTPKNAGFYLMRKEYKDALTPFDKPFPLCYRNGATVEQTWFCLMLHRLKVPLFFLKFPEQHWLWYLDQEEQSIDKSMVLHFCGLAHAGNTRYERLLANASRFEENGKSSNGNHPSETSLISNFDSQMLLDSSAPAGLKMQDNFVVTSHQYGWEVTLKALSVLSDPAGVLFDGFIENTFLWNLETNRSKKKIPYREPWVGFVHHPPCIPNWPSIAKHRLHDLKNTREWTESLKNCLGLFSLSDYLAQWVRNEWGVDCEVLRYPALSPDQVFSFESYKSQHPKILTMIGFWMRRYSSFQILKADGHRKVRPLLVDDPNSKGIEHVKIYEKEEAASRGCAIEEFQQVEIITRLSNQEYDNLLSKAVVFLDLIDASAVTTIVECLARCTPLLINRLPAVMEYLGEDYPLYFDSLEEAEEKLQDESMVLKAHEHMVENPMRKRITPQGFLDEFVKTNIYKRVLWQLSVCG